MAHAELRGAGASMDHIHRVGASLGRVLGLCLLRTRRRHGNPTPPTLRDAMPIAVPWPGLQNTSRHYADEFLDPLQPHDMLQECCHHMFANTPH